MLILFVSVFVEIIQFTFKFGIGDVDDVILNIVGGIDWMYIMSADLFDM